MAKDTWTVEQVDELRKWAEQGLSATQIGIQMKMTRNMIMGAIVRNQVALKNKKTTGWSKYVRKTPVTAEKPVAKPPLYELANAWPVKTGENSILFDEMEHEHCRFPLWGTEARTGAVCGNRRVPGKSYCRACLKLTYQQR